MGFAAGFSVGWNAVDSALKRAEEAKRLQEEKNAKVAKETRDYNNSLASEAEKGINEAGKIKQNFNKQKFEILKNSDLTEDQKVEAINTLTSDTEAQLNSYMTGASRYTGMISDKELAGAVNSQMQTLSQGSDFTKYAKVQDGDKYTYVNQQAYEQYLENPSQYGIGKDSNVYLKDKDGSLTNNIVAKGVSFKGISKESGDNEIVTIGENTPEPIMKKLKESGFKVGDKLQKSVYNSYAKKEDNKYSIYTTPSGQQFKMNRETGQTEIVSDPKISSKTPTIAMPDGSVAYADEDGNAMVGADGKIIYKTTSTTSQDLTSAGAVKKSLFAQLDLMEEVVKKNPSAVGSVGQNFTDFIGNIANDVLKIDTKDREVRERLDAFTGAIAAQLREMSGEDGVMTESDFERYMKMMPSKNDSPKAYANKMKMLRQDLNQKYGDQIKAFYGKKSQTILDNKKEKEKEATDYSSAFR